MVGKVMCIDALFSDRGLYRLERNKVYTIKRITGGRRVGVQGSRDLFLELVELPSVEYLLRRFEVVGNISITLPDDIYNLPLL